MATTVWLTDLMCASQSIVITPFSISFDLRPAEEQIKALPCCNHVRGKEGNYSCTRRKITRDLRPAGTAECLSVTNSSKSKEKQTGGKVMAVRLALHVLVDISILSPVYFV